MSKEKNNNKRKFAILLIAIMVFCVFSTIFSILNLFNNNIVNGVYINEIDIANYSKEDCVKKLSEITKNICDKNIVLQYDKTEIEISLKDMELVYNIEEAVSKAYEIGRDGNIFFNNFTIIKSLFLNKNINIETSLNEEKLDRVIDSLNENIQGIMENSSYYIESEELIITKGKSGIIVDKETLKKAIKEKINNLKDRDYVIEIPIINAKPDDIDIEKIYKEIYKEPKDAYISENPKTVHPNINGIDFAITIEEAKELIKNEEKDEYIIPLKITIANITLSEIGAEAFPNKLGNFYTKYDISNENRSTNIKLASDKIDGTIILPGETFSYNKIVGKRTIEAGYKEAGAYAGGKVVEEVGGGICQVSSTLYNAVLYADLDIVERYNHSFESSYVDASRDATVSWGTLDFKFKNNKNYPIKIIATSKNGVEDISIYGIKENDNEVIIQTKIISILERETRYEEDENLENGKESIFQNGHDGCVSEAYKLVRSNGKIISNTLLSHDTYYALDRIIKIGKKNV